MFTNQITNKHNLSIVKYIWFFIYLDSNILRPNVDRPNIKLKINDDIISDPLNLSKIFNEYFSSIANTPANNNPPSSTNIIENSDRLQNPFGFLPTDCNELQNVNLSFKSKISSLNEIPT